MSSAHGLTHVSTAAINARMDDLWNSYFAFTQHHAAGPVSASYLIAMAVLPLALLIPPTSLSHKRLAAIALPIIYVATADACYRLGSSDVIIVDNLWWSTYLLGFHDVRAKFRRQWNIGLKKPEKPATVISSDHETLRQAKDPSYALDPSRPHVVLEQSKYPFSFKERVAWVFTLVVSRPLSGWKFDDRPRSRRHLNPWPPRSRMSFVLDILQRLALSAFILIPLTLQLAKNDPYFTEVGYSAWQAYPETQGTKFTVTLLRALIPRIILRPLTLGVFAMSLLTVAFLILTPVPVLTNALFGSPVFYWSPHSWAPHFGSFYDGVVMNGVRGGWGIWWHGMMARMTSEPGKFLARKLEIPRSSPLRYFLISISAFTLSGLTHAGLVPPYPRLPNDVSSRTLRWHFILFFWIQPVGICIEHFAIEPILLGAGLKPVEAQGGTASIRARALVGKCFRLMWVIVWLAWSCSLLVLPYGQLHFWELLEPLYAIPVLGPIIHGTWIP